MGWWKKRRKGRAKAGTKETEGEEGGKRVRKKKNLADFEVNFFKKFFVVDKDFLAICCHSLLIPLITVYSFPVFVILTFRDSTPSGTNESPLCGRNFPNDKARATGGKNQFSD